MWKAFWGNETNKIERSNRRNVIPGAWRIEVTPAQSQLEDHFLHVFEIGDRGKTGRLRVELLHGDGIAGAGCAVTGEAGVAALFSAQDAQLDYVEATLPTFPCHTLWLGGLEPDRIYDLELAGSNLATGDAVAPGVPILSRQVRANIHGVIQLQSGANEFPAASRMRLHTV